MKKILFVNNWIHFKNKISLFFYKNIEFTEIENVEMLNNYDLLLFDCVYSPSQPINVKLYPNIKFILVHILVFFQN